MTSVSNRYPLSTADGKSIPLDAVRPYGLLPLAAVASSGSVTQSIPADVELFAVQATEDSYIQFSTAANIVAGALANGIISADTLLIPQGMHIVVSPPVDKPYFSVRAISTTGTVYIQYLESWSGLTLQSQITRR